jgi:dihydrofolate synthase / folylpolyglutamate synthase
MSELEQVISALYARRPESQIEPRLHATARAVELMGDPQRNYRIVHITGTNGKTSAARMIERILREHGLRTGRLTSPHLVRFNERIALDGEPVEDQRIIDVYHENLAILDLVDSELVANGEPKLTFFEAYNALAFQLFSDAPIDVLVLEVGIGGEWDASNVADGDVCVFTAIGLDHRKVLGDTVEEIATTKAGIIKSESIVVSNSQEPNVERILRDRAEQGAFVAGVDFALIDASSDGFGTRFSVQGSFGSYPQLWMPIIGTHQAENAATAIVAVEQFLGRAIADEVLRSALADTVSPGRMHVVSKEPLVVLDGAHNPPGIRAFRNSLQEHFGNPSSIGVVGMLADKDVYSSALEFVGVFDHLIITSSNSERSMSAGELAEVFEDSGVFVTEVIDDFETAYDKALRLSEETSMQVFVTGSLYLVGAVLGLIQERVDSEEE